MSSTNTSTSTGTGTTSGSSSGSKLKSMATGYGGIIGFSLLAIGLFIGAFVSMSNFVGSKDDWNLIQPQITKILILTLIGTFSLMAAALLYFIQDSARTIYFILVISCLSLGLSFSSLAISAISS
jgi:hypothetical protein